MNLNELSHYLDQYLRISEINDYGPQGLQVETDNHEVAKVALAVDSAPAVIEAAADWGADMLLVHHGLFWGGPQNIAGPMGKRVRAFMRTGVNLYAAHLPLDAHPEVGNNAVLAQMFGLQNIIWWGNTKGTPLGVCGDVRPILLQDLEVKVNAQLKTKSRTLQHGPGTVKRIAILSGGGAGMVEEAASLGADTFITGETSHSQYWLASDFEINVIFGGHYATETVGVQALGAHLSEKFNLDTKFFDFPTEM
ncbi:MAG: dinuclear metal center YbgI/SA1388 family protein [Cellvibrionaceae bacterium]|jgi:dinuclear metal center YbgI/SA1388 family protein